MTPSKVDDLIAEMMLKHPSQTDRAVAAYFEAVHQQLAPLARDLEAKLELEKQKNRELQAEIDSLTKETDNARIK